MINAFVDIAKDLILLSLMLMLGHIIWCHSYYVTGKGAQTFYFIRQPY